MQKFPKTLIGFYWMMLKKFKWFAIIVTIAGTLQITIAMISWPLVMRYFISMFEYSGPDFRGYVIGAFAMIIFWMNAELPLLSINRTYGNYWRPRNRHAIRDLLLGFIYSHDYRFFLDKNVGTIQSQVGTISEKFNQLTTQVVTDFAGIILGFVALTGMMMNLDTTIMAIIGGWGVARLAWVVLYSKTSANYEKELSKLNASNNGIVSDSISNFATVKIFATRFFEGEYMQKERAELLSTNWRWVKFNFFNQEAIGFVNDAIGIFVMYLLVMRFAAGAMSVTEASFILAAFFVLTRNLGSLGHMYNGTIEAYAGAAQAWSDIMAPQAVADKPNAKALLVKRGAMDLRGISFRYNDKSDVIKDLSLKVKPGEKIGLVGLSGAGKTTLSHLLLRLFDVQRGGIYVDGQNIKNVSQDSLRKQVAFVPQDPALFNRTLRENIGYAKPGATLDEIQRAAKLADVHDFIMSTENGYDTIAGNRGIILSGGQKQRIAIARAILKDAPILILDEATAALDSETEATIQKSFDVLMRGRTTVVIAHRLSTLRKMDRIVVMEKGRIAEQGSHAALLKKGGIFAKLWKMQSGGFIQE
ncbi:MAG: ABC transporter ATP-binding protein/permease [Alphaproteobacteria bacterium]|nr:ABC transporter ATP-binding protein/permease [Alphaproteobacteria bacterium]MCL2758029.1 ABC transporter ATP-binding protein/permease [Alphaproteobacteria bacterium]